MSHQNCVVCGDESTDETPNIGLPCLDHWACRDCVPSYFTRAAENENLYPPSCCYQPLSFEQFIEYLPSGVVVEFLAKQEEYSVLARSRVYCAKTSCGKFVHPDFQKTDPETAIHYAICPGKDCGSTTCVKCKNLIINGIKGHICEVQKDEAMFKEVAAKEGYQSCPLCTRWIELSEACNHMTCECGYGFCYICGKQWDGIHGCPQYGRAAYDEEGYNQDGFHRDTGLNRDGRTRRQQLDFDRGQDGDDADSDEEDDDEDEHDPNNDVLRHVDQDTRDMINNMPPQQREETLMLLRVQLFEEQGITFQDPPQPPHHDEDDGESDDDEDEDRGDDDDELQEEDDENDEGQDDSEEEGDDMDEHEGDDQGSEEGIDADDSNDLPIIPGVGPDGMDLDTDMPLLESPEPSDMIHPAEGGVDEGIGNSAVNAQDPALLTASDTDVGSFPQELHHNEPIDVDTDISLPPDHEDVQMVDYDIPEVMQPDQS
ncbi:hypothetical protein CC80DRAFT_107196 [Byssothecium circinans]|uniref:RBR-type E3 ubiquitin transferase n=1 Tax=Byssothecium circinans TaxID=147558 RepID=A0A6A5UJR9_9PLEO|nr:hypothetical protein CC80DRAFT_107196 [Byssothecium circinans]